MLFVHNIPDLAYASPRSTNFEAMPLTPITVYVRVVDFSHAHLPWRSRVHPKISSNTHKHAMTATTILTVITG